MSFAGAVSVVERGAAPANPQLCLKTTDSLYDTANECFATVSQDSRKYSSNRHMMSLAAFFLLQAQWPFDVQ